MKGLSKEEELLFKDLSQRLSYKVKCNVYGRIGILTGVNDYGAEIDYGNGEDTTCEIKYCRPYLRPMSSMTEEEKKELLCTIVGKNAVKYFQVLPDGSIDNTDAAHQDLHNFTMHWINFDGSNTTSYIDWLNANYFDYRKDDEGKTMIENGLAIEVTEKNNPYK